MYWKVNVPDTEHIRSGYQATANTHTCILPLLRITGLH